MTKIVAEPYTLADLYADCERFLLLEEGRGKAPYWLFGDDMEREDGFREEYDQLVATAVPRAVRLLLAMGKYA